MHTYNIIQQVIIMTYTILEPGTQVTTKRGDGVIMKVDMTTYGIPMYHVLLIDGEYGDESVYISDPRITPEISQPVPFDGDVNEIRADLEFDTMRNLITGTVTCRQCAKQYHEAADTEIIDIETDEPAFYCVVCGERL